MVPIYLTRSFGKNSKKKKCGIGPTFSLPFPYSGKTTTKKKTKKKKNGRKKKKKGYTDFMNRKGHVTLEK